MSEVKLKKEINLTDNPNSAKLYVIFQFQLDPSNVNEQSSHSYRLDLAISTN